MIRSLFWDPTWPIATSASSAGEYKSAQRSMSLRTRVSTRGARGKRAARLGVGRHKPTAGRPSHSKQEPPVTRCSWRVSGTLQPRLCTWAFQPRFTPRCLFCATTSWQTFQSRSICTKARGSAAPESAREELVLSEEGEAGDFLIVQLKRSRGRWLPLCHRGISTPRRERATPLLEWGAPTPWVERCHAHLSRRERCASLPSLHPSRGGARGAAGVARRALEPIAATQMKCHHGEPEGLSMRPPCSAHCAKRHCGWEDLQICRDVASARGRPGWHQAPIARCAGLVAVREEGSRVTSVAAEAWTRRV